MQATSLTNQKAGGTESDFKSLGVETVPLTSTSIVKFRQQLSGIPVYGSLISVELDEANEMISLNSNMAKPNLRLHGGEDLALRSAKKDSVRSSIRARAS